MPIVKAISRHTNCQKVKTYLEKRNLARIYKHFIISPDPDDHIDLPALRELAGAWP